MKRFNIVLSDEDYAKLEARRVELGLRSWAEVVRALLHAGDSEYEHLMREIVEREPDPERKRPGAVIPLTKAEVKALARAAQKPPVPYGSRLKRGK